jgi:hypothetical protein
MSAPSVPVRSPQPVSVTSDTTGSPRPVPPAVAKRLVKAKAGTPCKYVITC